MFYLIQEHVNGQELKTCSRSSCTRGSSEIGSLRSFRKVWIECTIAKCVYLIRLKTLIDKCCIDPILLIKQKCVDETKIIKKLK